jgi:hypothetical protein
MALYTKPTLHNGSLNTVFNTSDFEENSTALTIGTADSRYLKLSGGTETGNVSFTNGLTSSATVTVPTITFSAGPITQTAAQLGYTRSFNSAITGGSLVNGGASAPSFNTLSISSGVYIITYYHTIYCTASVTFSQIVHGITTSSTGVYTNQATTQSSYVSETLATGNKYITGTYTFRSGGTQNIYAPLTITYTTTGTVSINLGMTAMRIA